MDTGQRKRVVFHSTAKTRCGPSIPTIVCEAMCEAYFETRSVRGPNDVVALMLRHGCYEADAHEVLLRLVDLEERILRSESPRGVPVSVFGSGCRVVGKPHAAHVRVLSKWVAATRHCLRLMP